MLDRVYAAPLKLDGLTVEDAGFQIRRLSDTLAQAGGVDSVTVADGLPLDFRYRMESVSLEVDANVAPTARLRARDPRRGRVSGHHGDPARARARFHRG